MTTRRVLDRVPLTQLSQDAKDVFSTPQGRRLLAYLMAECHVYTPIHSHDPYEAAFRNGMRNAALLIASLQGYRPSDFVENAMATTRELEDLLNERRNYPH